MTEQETFEQQLAVFSIHEQASLFFDLCKGIIEKFGIRFSQKYVRFSTSSDERLGLSVVVGNRTVLSVKRWQGSLALALLLPQERLSDYQGIESHYLKHYEFKADAKEENLPPVLVSFEIDTSKQFQALEDFYADFEACAAYEITKGRQAKRNESHNFYFYQACTEADYRQACLPKIGEGKEFQARLIEEDKQAEENDYDDYSFDPLKVTIAHDTFSLHTIVNKLQFKEIVLDPDFQREANLWNDKQKSRLIESLLLRLPLPMFYFDQIDADNWIVIDGLQRLSAFYDFMVDKTLKLKGLTVYNRGDENLEGKDYNGLPSKMKRRLSEAPIRVYLANPATPENAKYALFHRINTGGLTLNAQEIRTALNQKSKGEASRFLKDLVELPIFRKTVRIASGRMQDREVALRFVAFQILPSTEYTSSMSKFLDEAMKMLQDKKDAEQNNIKQKFEQALQLAYKILGDNVFSSNFETEKAPLNRPLYDVQLYYLAQFPAEFQPTEVEKEAILNDFKALLEDKKFREAITSGTNGTQKVELRFKEAYNLFKKYYPDLTPWRNAETTENQEF